MKQYQHKTYQPNNNNIAYNIQDNQNPLENKPSIDNININNQEYITDNNTGKQILYDNIPSEKFDKVETYIIDPKTGKEIKIDEKNNMENEKYKKNTYTGNDNIVEKIYNNIYQYDQQQEKLKSSKNTNKNIQNTHINEKDNSNYIATSPVIEQLNLNATVLPTQNDINQIYNSIVKSEIEDKRLSASILNVSTLSNIEYRNYPKAKKSFEPFENIAGFGLNSYNGKRKNFNEDRINAYPNKVIQKEKNYNISYFSIFDGHSGNKCSEFLKKNFSGYLFNSPFFPKEPLKAIHESFRKAEHDFFRMVYDVNNKKLLDKSGSCALIMLIIDNILYSINLGDSRALYSYNTGKCLLQITRDHKPNDETEKKRIENAGGSIYYANKIHRNGKEIELKEENFGKGFTFPYRIKPGGLAVSYKLIIFFYFLIYCR